MQSFEKESVAPVTLNPFIGYNEKILAKQGYRYALENDMMNGFNSGDDMYISASTKYIAPFYILDLSNSLQNKLSGKRLSMLIKFKSFEFSISVSKGKMVIAQLKFYEKVIIKKVKRSRKSERKEGSYIYYYNTTKKDKRERESSGEVTRIRRNNTWT